MSTTIPISFRVSENKYALLEKVATAYDRPKSWLLDRALDAYLQREAAFIAAVAEGVNDADAGRFVEHDTVTEWLDSWGTSKELDPPIK